MLNAKFWLVNMEHCLFNVYKYLWRYILLRQPRALSQAGGASETAKRIKQLGKPAYVYVDFIENVC